MSVATQIERIRMARDKIRTKLIALGLTTSTADIDTCATAVDGIVNRGNVSAEVKEGETYTIQKGYYPGNGTVTAVAGGGNYKLQSKTLTPTKSKQSATPDDGFYGLSDVTINPIPGNYQDTSSVNATAADVLSPKIIVDKQGKTVAGTMPNNGTISREIDGMVTDRVSIPKGYTSGGTVILTPSVENALAEI